MADAGGEAPGVIARRRDPSLRVLIVAVDSMISVVADRQVTNLTLPEAGREATTDSEPT